MKTIDFLKSNISEKFVASYLLMCMYVSISCAMQDIILNPNLLLLSVKMSADLKSKIVSACIVH